MTRTRQLQKLDHFFRGGRLPAFLITMTLAAAMVLSAIGQGPAQNTPPGISQPAAPQVQRPPQLPDHIAKQVAGEEKTIHEALVKIDDLELINAAIPIAERVLQVRTTQQGGTWWETINAGQDSADLRRLSTMLAKQRTTLAQAERAGGQFADLWKAGKYDQATEAVLTMASAQRQILGEDHPWYANSLGILAQVYYTQGGYAQAEPLFKRVLAIREKALGADHPAVPRP